MCAQRRTASTGRRSRNQRGTAARQQPGTGGAATATLEQGITADVASASERPVATSARPARPVKAEQSSEKVTDKPRAAQAQPSGTNQRLAGARRLIDDTRAELRRVTWPDRETTMRLTMLVVAVAAVMGAALGGLDFVLFQLFEIL